MDHRAQLIAVGAAAGAAAAYLYMRRWNGGLFIPRGRPTPMAPVSTDGVLSKGSVCVIIGCASGIGRATALRCAAIGMKVALADVDAIEMEATRIEVLAAGAADALSVVCDCRILADVERLKEAVYSKFGACHLLMNNAAVQTNGECSPYDHSERWRKIIETNLMGVYHGGLAFVQSMIEQDCPCVVVNTGSKQGITCPPGDAAYNVSKAGVKVLTEALQHSLRSQAGCKVNAFLLVPGFTATKIITRGQKWPWLSIRP